MNGLLGQMPAFSGLLGQPEVKQRPAGILNSAPPESPLDALYRQYGGLKRFGIQLKDSTDAGKDWRGEPYAGRKMEFYPADESYNPNPGKPTVELFDKGVGEKDVLGEIFSHLLPSVDQTFGKARADFVGSIDDKQKEILYGDYESQMQSGLFPKDKAPTFEQWLDTVGGDAFFRGYIADQYPKEFYRQDQVQLFEQLLNQLKTE